jgi:hypothetical protein
MPNNITVTSKTGPALTVTAQVISNVRDIEFRLVDQVLKVTDINSKISHFDLYGTTTVTYSVTTHVATVAVSQ